MNKKIAIIYLQYDKDKYPYSFPYVFGHLNKLSYDKQYFLIDNKVESGGVQKFDNVFVLPGDNSNWEFSGWQKGLDYVKNNIDCDLVLFLNDSLTSYRDHKMLELNMLEEILDHSFSNSIFCGRLDMVEHEMYFMDYDVRSWICTNCFAAPRSLFENVDIDNSHLFEVEDIAKSLDFFMSSDKLNKGLKTHIYNWLTYQWHGRFDINSDIQLFKNKTKAILNEKLLTVKIRENNISILNTLDGRAYK
jgi:hypothetical protein